MRTPIGTTFRLLSQPLSSVAAADIATCSTLLRSFSIPIRNATHADEGREHLPLSAYEWNSRLKYFVKSGRLPDARHLFDTMPLRDVASWTIIISAYVAASDTSEAVLLFSRMWSLSVAPDPFVLSVTLKACVRSRCRLGQPIHAYAVKSDLARSVFVASALLDMYAKTGLLDASLQVFDEMPLKNVVTWTAAVTALCRAGRPDDAIQCFVRMRRARVTCDSHTFAIVLKACADMGQLTSGREIHAQLVRFGFDTAPFVANTLSALYNKCGRMKNALILFERMKDPDVVSWTTAISTLTQMGREEQAVQEFVKMLEQEGDSTRPNEYTFAAVISACAGLARVKWGEQLHALAIQVGVAGSLSTSNATITMYARCGCLEAATRVFQEMAFTDIVSWTAIISGNAQEGHAEAAFMLFSDMHCWGTKANEFTVASLLSVCAQMAMLEQGRQLHACVISEGLDNESMVHSSLVSMYAKCGCVGEAWRTFDTRKWENVVSWTSMINGFADHGDSVKAIDLFDRMLKSTLKPDNITFIGVLTACSHAGLIDRAFKYFEMMQETYGINPEKEHFGCMVDLLCQAGRLNEAEEMIESMPFKTDDVMWSILLQACRIHGNANCGRRAMEKILDLQPDSAGSLIAMSNVYAAKGLWMDVADLRVLMRSKGVRKEPGSSWITIGQEMAVFVSADRKHPNSDEIYTMLGLLTPRTKLKGNVHGRSSLLVGEEE